LFISKIQDKNPFASWEITFRNPHSVHLFHKDEGITENLIIDVLRSIKTEDIQDDPRKLRKRIRLFHVTKHLTEHVRITIIFQIFAHQKRVHVINAYLGSFHTKNLFEEMGLKEVIEK